MGEGIAGQDRPTSDGESAQDLCQRVAAARTRHLTVVVEDIYQPHNGAALIRACDCFGIQDLHAVCPRNPFRVSEEVVSGADAHVDVHRYEEDAASVLERLKLQGYHVAATTLRPGAASITELDISRPVALLFGTEEEGLSDAAHEAADSFVQIPMYGFTQSFNISVSAALCLNELTNRMREANIDWCLTESEQAALVTRWLGCE